MGVGRKLEDTNIFNSKIQSEASTTKDHFCLRCQRGERNQSKIK